MYQSAEEIKSELADINTKIRQIMTYTNSPEFDALPRQEARLLMKQASSMMDYASILMDRIRNFRKHP